MACPWSQYVSKASPTNQDDIVISGKTVEDHLNNLRHLLVRLNDRRLRCRIQKCVFAQDSVTYRDHTISRDGISKGPKADAFIKMPAHSNVSQLRSFLDSVQFYNKFLPDLCTIPEPLYHLMEKHTNGNGKNHNKMPSRNWSRCLQTTPSWPTLIQAVLSESHVMPRNQV